MLNIETITCYRDYIRSYNEAPESQETSIKLNHLHTELNNTFDMFRANTILHELTKQGVYNKINAENRLMNVEHLLRCGEL